ncbi:DinB-like domain-containing protein [Pararobbsia alpina]|uniref:DinB family protein n=1 Tax=Pararobbsia alpina TaxID=621374 RepID=UPI0039A63937
MTNFKQSMLLNQLREMPHFLEQAFLGASSVLLTRIPTNDSSPLIEHLWHVRDCESDLYSPRILRVINEVRPRLNPVDVSAWPVERGYHLRAGDQAIREFSSLRLGLVQQLEEAPELALDRVGVRFDDSEVDVYFLIEQLVDHDRDHRWRMSAILREIAENTRDVASAL